MKALPFTLTLLLAACAGQQQVVVTNPTTPPPEGFVSTPSTPAPTSANTVQPTRGRDVRLDTLARPRWLNARIESLAALPANRNRLAKVYRYRYDGETVYLITATAPDEYSTLYTLRGQVLCHPSGGLTGRGDGRCGDFEKRRADEVLVWQQNL